jgi:hypothetical protein
VTVEMAGIRAGKYLDSLYLVVRLTAAKFAGI